MQNDELCIYYSVISDVSNLNFTVYFSPMLQNRMQRKRMKGEENGFVTPRREMMAAITVGILTMSYHLGDMNVEARTNRAGKIYNVIW